MYISREQTRAARALLGISQTELSEMASIDRVSLSRFELGKQNMHRSTSDKIFRFFDNRGIAFLKNNGVAFKQQNNVRELVGRDGFAALMDDVYQTVAAEGGEVCLSNADERNWILWYTQENYDNHSKRMNNLPHNYKFKIFIVENDDFLIASQFAEYKYIPKEYFNDQSFYVYGDKIALIAFEQNSVVINILQNKGWADSFRHLFNYAWSHTPEIKS